MSYDCVDGWADLTGRFESHGLVEIDDDEHDGAGVTAHRCIDALDAIVSALRKFTDTVEATGGVKTGEDGMTAPLGDTDWIDLGEAYLAARAALGKATEAA